MASATAGWSLPTQRNAEPTDRPGSFYCLVSNPSGLICSSDDFTFGVDLAAVTAKAPTMVSGKPVGFYHKPDQQTTWVRWQPSPGEDDSKPPVGLVDKLLPMYLLDHVASIVHELLTFIHAPLQSPWRDVLNQEHVVQTLLTAKQYDMTDMGNAYGSFVFGNSPNWFDGLYLADMLNSANTTIYNASMKAIIALGWNGTDFWLPRLRKLSYATVCYLAAAQAWHRYQTRCQQGALLQSIRSVCDGKGPMGEKLTKISQIVKQAQGQLDKLYTVEGRQDIKLFVGVPANGGQTTTAGALGSSQATASGAVSSQAIPAAKPLAMVPKPSPGPSQATPTVIKSPAINGQARPALAKPASELTTAEPSGLVPPPATAPSAPLTTTSKTTALSAAATAPSITPTLGPVLSVKNAKKRPLSSLQQDDASKLPIAVEPAAKASKVHSPTVNGSSSTHQGPLDMLANVAQVTTSTPTRAQTTEATLGAAPAKPTTNKPAASSSTVIVIDDSDSYMTAASESGASANKLPNAKPLTKDSKVAAPSTSSKMS